MRIAPLLWGALLGVAVIVLAWTRGWESASTAGAPTGPLRAVSASAAAPPAPPAAGAVPAPTAVSSSDVDTLRARELLVPVVGFDRRLLRNDFGDPRVGHAHEALDLLAPRGTPVLAVDEGFVAKLFTSVRGGLTVYQFDSGQSYCYYYAHLDGYAPGLREGAALHKGSPIGFVGTTGNAPPQTPHLHFAIFKLGPERRWWEGTPVNPFFVWSAPG